MPDESPAAVDSAPDPADEQTAAAIKDEEATLHGPRGNVHSEADEPVEQDMPPPLPN